jgi:hypothetical protein
MPVALFKRKHVVVLRFATNNLLLLHELCSQTHQKHKIYTLYFEIGLPKTQACSMFATREGGW